MSLTMINIMGPMKIRGTQVGADIILYIALSRPVEYSERQDLGYCG